MEAQYHRGVLDRPEVLELFARQCGVATMRQLVEVGVPERTLQRARGRGVIKAVLPGVVELGGFTPGFRQRAMAAQLFGAAGCFLDGATAGRLYGLRGMPKRPIDLLTASRRRAAVPSWLRVTCSTWIGTHERVQRPDGLWVAKPPRMLLGLAARLNDASFELAAEDAWHLQLASPNEVAEYLDTIAGRGRRGIATLRRWVERVAGRSRPAQSRLEIKVARAAVAAGLPEPARQHPVTLADGVVVHIDLAWPDLKLGFEPGHSWWHGGDLGQRADQQRRRECAAVGWQIESYDESAATSLAAVGAEMATIYRQRRALLGR